MTDQTPREREPSAEALAFAEAWGGEIPPEGIDAFARAADTFAAQAAAERVQQTWLSDADILAGAKFYARAYVQRAVHGIIPQWDDEADEAEWERAPQDRRDEMLDMVRGIVVAAEFKRRQDAASERAIAILDAAERAKPEAGDDLPKPTWRMLVERLYRHGVVSQIDLIEAVTAALAEARRAGESAVAREGKLIAALEMAAGRFDDIARIVERDGAYTNIGFFRMSAKRCRDALSTPSTAQERGDD